MSRFSLYLAYLGIAFLLQPGSALAQTTQTSIQGVVFDNTKKPLPGATVVIRNESTGFSTGTVSNANGKYLFKELPLGGPYTVRAS